MNWKRTAATIGLLVATAVLLRWLTKSPLSAEAERKEAIEHVIQAYSASIAFYGRVVDQYGDPVPEARVSYGAIDHFLSKGSDYSGYSDANGYFSIEGIRGIALTVGVWKEGYYAIDGRSAGAFAYGINPDSTRSLPPTKGSPAIFLLHKMGETEPLIQVSSRQFDVPPTGQTISIDLATGRTGQGQLHVASWMGEVGHRPFDWRYRLSLPGGGLVERKGQFDFEAPADGYQPVVEVNMPSTAENWASRLTKQYFAKIADGKYARFSIEFFAGDRSFIVFESYLNPNSDSRNLEFDPKKLVRPNNPLEEE